MRFQPSRRHVLTGLGAMLVGCTGGGSTQVKGGPTSPNTGLTNTTGQPGATATTAGFSMPAEWGPHSGTIMQFPPATNYCFGGNGDCNFIENARQEWAATARAIAEFEPVILYATPGDAAEARNLCGAGVTVLEAPLSDGWSRDTGPIILTNEAGESRAACFEFNGWGGSVEYTDDALIKWRMAADLGVESVDVDMVLEGGAVILDGAGTLITTEQCLLHPTRNPSMSVADQEAILKEVLGVHTIIWLAKGWVPDPLTNGHVDGICAFIEPGTVFVNTLNDQGDDNYPLLLDAKARLQAAGLETVDLPATSYTAFHINYYVCNGGVIVPIQGAGWADDTPLGLIADRHPNHQVVGVQANTLGSAGGGIHCITQQLPAAVAWPV